MSRTRSRNQVNADNVPAPDAFQEPGNQSLFDDQTDDDDRTVYDDDAGDYRKAS